MNTKEGTEVPSLHLKKKMITEQQIRNLVETKLAETPNFIVDLSVKPGNKITVFLDSDDKVSIEDCVQVSRHIESNLNRDEEDFELQVSSAGMDQPLKLVRQYKKHIGKQIQTVTKDGKKTIGTLTAADDNGITIEEKSKQKVEGKKSKQIIVNNIHIVINNIKETKRVISF